MGVGVGEDCHSATAGPRTSHNILTCDVGPVTAMVAKLDESVGRVVAALQNRYMLDNTIIVFMSDNGAASKDVDTARVNFYPNWGSNFPLRGVGFTNIYL